MNEGQPVMGYATMLVTLGAAIAATFCPLASRAEVTPASTEMLLIQGATMGTTYHIKLVGNAATTDVKLLRNGIENELVAIDEQMSTWRPDSELSRFNRAPPGEWFAVSSATARVAAAARGISEETGGALDVTVGPLVRLWHFGPSAKATAPAARFRPPSQEQISSAQEKVGFKKLEVRLQPPALRKAVAGLEVDLSSIASGYAIDRLCAVLDARGVENYMVELGGEVRARGRRNDGQPWRVGVERPTTGRPQMKLAAPLSDAAIATAGDSQKFFEYEGRRYSHVIDPATGRPMLYELASVTVLADDCLTADGWDTPLLVMGPERGLQCATKNNIAALFLWQGPDGQLHERATPAWSKLIGPNNDSGPTGD